MEITLALIGVVSAIIALLTALAGRKKIIENRHITIVKNEKQSFRNNRASLRDSDKKWYDKHFWVALALLFLYPVGLYALIQSRTISKNWKWILGIAFFFIFVLAAGGKK